MSEYYATISTRAGLSELGQMAIIEKSGVRAKPISIPPYKSGKIDNLAAKLRPGDVIYVALFYAIAQNLDGLALLFRLFSKLQVRVIKISFSVDDEAQFTQFTEEDFVETADIIRQENLILRQKKVGAASKLSNSAMVQLVEDYQSGNFTVAQLLEKYKISGATLYKYLDKQGAPIRSKRRERGS